MERIKEYFRNRLHSVGFIISCVALLIFAQGCVILALSYNPPKGEVPLIYYYFPLVIAAFFLFIFASQTSFFASFWKSRNIFVTVCRIILITVVCLVLLNQSGLVPVFPFALQNIQTNTITTDWQTKNTEAPNIMKEHRKSCSTGPDLWVVKKSDVVQIAQSMGISSATTSNVAAYSCNWYFKEQEIQVCTQCPASGTRVNRKFNVDPKTSEVFNFSDTFCRTCAEGVLI